MFQFTVSDSNSYCLFELFPMTFCRILRIYNKKLEEVVFEPEVISIHASVIYQIL